MNISAEFAQKIVDEMKEIINQHLNFMDTVAILLQAQSMCFVLHTKFNIINNQFIVTYAIGLEILT